MGEPRVYTEKQFIEAAKNLGPAVREAVNHVLAALAMQRLAEAAKAAA